MPSKDAAIKRASNKKWRENNKEKLLEIQRAYRLKNKDKVRANERAAYERKYRENSEKYLLKNKKWRNKNIERRNEIERKSYARNRSSRTTYLNGWRDKQDPSRPLRRSLKSFKHGNCTLGEFIKQSRTEIDNLNGRLSRIWGGRGLCGSIDKDSEGSGECS